uniref:Telomere repeat binding bouquet formation protein 2 n=1 Tax=Zosterops lateralis melanops TaxID=1220523 RepID=A0A8D2P3G4_ZOSLA
MCEQEQVLLWKPALFLSSSIHESLSYLEGKATVFHSRYLSVCGGADAGAGDKPSVVLGHFVLPPACLQEGQAKNHLGIFSQGNPPLVQPWWKHDSLRGTTLEGLSPLPRHMYEETDSEEPAQGEFPYRALQEYPINNMVTGYPSARDMKKYEGELHDFIPGTSGYAAYWVQSKFSIYSEKTKMKRKL